ncbi:hypothetical protein DITRI_Ditri12bG0165700 [Diplodiscus trichospermus]
MQEEGWPLILQPLNARIGLVRNRDFSGSVSFTTLLTASPSFSSISSSDLDTESRGSFFHDKSIRLGSLIGISSFLEQSSTDAVDANNTQSLGHFLEAERRAAANIYRRNQTPVAAYGPGDFSPLMLISEPNSLFAGDQIAPRSDAALGAEDGRKSDTELLEHGTGHGVPLFLSCLCGQIIELGLR